MNRHPIPQDIMSVEFKLFGELTLKQFMYVGTGGVIAYIAIASGLPLLIKIIIAFIAGAGGAALALVPVNNRPLEVWVGNFIQAMINPTKRVWKKGENPNTPKTVYSLEEYNRQVNKVTPAETAINDNAYEAPTIQASSTSTVTPAIPNAVAATVVATNTLPPVTPTTPTVVPTTSPAITPLPTPTNVTTTPEGKISTEKTISQPAPTIQNLISAPNNTTIEANMDNSTNTNKNLQELLQSTPAAPQAAPSSIDNTTPAASPSQQLPQARKILVLDLKKLREHSSNLPGFQPKPNVIKGIVKNTQGNLVSGAIVIIKRKENNQPARAMVTNGLGEFETTSPLDNGNYLIDISHSSIELPLYEITLDSEPVPPLQFQLTA